MMEACYISNGKDLANLDRAQVIKGWVDSEGESQERIYDAACSDDRAIMEGW